MTNEELVALIQAGERDRLPELWEQVERFVALQDVEDGIQRDYTRQAVRQALEQLPTEERLAIKAYYYEGLTVKASGGARILERAELHLRRLLADKREGIRP